MQRAREYYDNGWINYATTNESLESLDLGLKLREGGNIFGILGSGDVRYLSLARGLQGEFTDFNSDQIEYVKLRDLSLINGDLDDFFSKGCDSSAGKIADMSREEYLSKLDLNKIKENLGKVKIRKRDIFNDSLDLSKYNKFYLSNALEWNNTLKNLEIEELLYSFSSKLKKGDLIYFVEGKEFREEGHYDSWNPEGKGVIKNEELTNLSKKHTLWHWIPQVWEKI